MDRETQALLDSLTDEQIKHIRKMMNAIIPIFKVFAGAIMDVLDDDQKVMLGKIVEEANR
jgi:hypothetical protein